MTTRVKDALGRFGEDLAARGLVAADWQLLERNWRCRDGELDIVARDGATVVFVEVKTRSSTLYGDPAEAVSPRKAARIRRLAARWLAEHPEIVRDGVRFDVVTVLRSPGAPTVRHIRAAF